MIHFCVLGCDAVRFGSSLTKFQGTVMYRFDTDCTKYLRNVVTIYWTTPRGIQGDRNFVTNRNVCEQKIVRILCWHRHNASLNHAHASTHKRAKAHSRVYVDKSKYSAGKVEAGERQVFLRSHFRMLLYFAMYEIAISRK